MDKVDKAAIWSSIFLLISCIGLSLCISLYIENAIVKHICKSMEKSYCANPQGEEK